MSKFFDIIPPKKLKEARQGSPDQDLKPSRSGNKLPRGRTDGIFFQTNLLLHNKIVWLLLVFFALLVIIFIFEFKTINQANKVKTQKSSIPSGNTSMIENQKKTTNNTITAAVTPPATAKKVRLINASSKPENLDLAIKLLTGQGFSIEQTSVVGNRFNQTNIYYRKDQQDLAQKAETALNGKFIIATDLSATLSDSYDLLIILGGN